MESEPPPSVYALNIIFFLIADIWQIPLAILLLLILIICSALISGSEVAYFSLSPSDVEELKEEDIAKSKRVLHLKKEPNILLATILIFNNFINISIVIVSYYIFSSLLPDTLYLSWSDTINQSFNSSFDWLPSALEFLITTIVATFILVLLGEVTPKIYANLNNIGFSKFMSRPLSILIAIMLPITKRLVRITSRIERKVESAQAVTHREDMDRAIELAIHSKDSTDDDVDILKGIIKFGDVSVKQIMKSRVDVTAIDVGTQFHELMKTIKNSGYSRIPIYKDEFDSIVGILYVKDLLGHHEEEDAFHWQSLIRKNVLYAPESKKINELLKDIQNERMHMAIVVDEYGGSSGIVTLEDVMEEVIGDIQDEFDNEEIDFVKLDEKNYIFEGKTLLNDVCRVLDINTEEFDDMKGESDTIAGLILEIKGRIPKEGLEIIHERYTFKILAANKRRIERIKLSLK